LYGIDHDKRNWSWLLCSHKPVEPPAAPKNKPSTKGPTRSTSGIAGVKSGEDEAPPREEGTVFSRDFLEEEDDGEGTMLSVYPVKEEEVGVGS